MSELDLRSCKLESAVLEVRYKEAFLLWDRAGHVAAAIHSRLPNVVLKSAQPASITFQLNNQIDIGFELARSVVTHYGADFDLEQLAEVSSVVLDCVSSELKVVDFTRVGLRVRYWKSAGSEVEASKLFPTHLLGRGLASSTIAKEAELTSAESSARWEAKGFGLLAAIRTQSRTLNINIPTQLLSDVELKTPNESFGVVQDFDYFTKGIVSAELVRPKLWIPQGLQAIRKAHRSVTQA